MTNRRIRHLLYTAAALLLALALSALSQAVTAPVSSTPSGSLALAPHTASSSLALPPHATSTAPLYHVVKVVDGDTIDIDLDGTTTRLRLIGMDTPEVVDQRKPVQCFGRAASAKGHELLDDQWVSLEYDDVAGMHDKYGRTLAYVFRADGLFYNEYMIREGFAHEYDYDNQKYKYRSLFRQAQQEAEAHLRGFWAPDTCAGNTTKPEGAQ